MTRGLLFHRDFQGFTGGHGKVFDYFRHTEGHPLWTPAIHFSAGAAHPENPWRQAGIVGDSSWQPDQADALFLAGIDWRQWPEDDVKRPVINLIQHVRHADADAGADVHGFLSRPAIRVCVSAPVADAILATGKVRGPVQVIDAALDVPALGSSGERHVDVVVAATKQPALGRAIAARLESDGMRVKLLDGWYPKREYLAFVSEARIAVCLPHRTEGFYLPALEAMALGCAVVVPDCLGNRAYVQDRINALVPEFTIEAIVAAVAALRDGDLHQALVRRGASTAERFGQAREREAFHRLLDELDGLWKEAW